jgi:hypothetical protein
MSPSVPSGDHSDCRCFKWVGVPPPPSRSTAREGAPNWAEDLRGFECGAAAGPTPRTARGGRGGPHSTHCPALRRAAKDDLRSPRSRCRKSRGAFVDVPRRRRASPLKPMPQGSRGCGSPRCPATPVGARAQRGPRPKSGIGARRVSAPQPTMSGQPASSAHCAATCLGAASGRGGPTRQGQAQSHRPAAAHDVRPLRSVRAPSAAQGPSPASGRGGPQAPMRSPKPKGPPQPHPRPGRGVDRWDHPSTKAHPNTPGGPSKVEAAGVEPASEKRSSRVSTCVDSRSDLAPRRFVSDRIGASPQLSHSTREGTGAEPAQICDVSGPALGELIQKRTAG